MAEIKVFSAQGVQVLQCFDTLDDVPFMPVQEPIEDEDIDDGF